MSGYDGWMDDWMEREGGCRCCRGRGRWWYQETQRSCCKRENRVVFLLDPRPRVEKKEKRKRGRGRGAVQVPPHGPTPPGFDANPKPASPPPPLTPQLETPFPSHEQERLAAILLRGLAPAERRHLATVGSGRGGAPTPDLLHDRARRRTVPDALCALLGVEPAQQKLAVGLVVREAPAETDAEDDAAQHRARDVVAVAAAAAAAAAAPCRAPRWRHALQTLDRLAHAVADLAAAWVLAR